MSENKICCNDVTNTTCNCEAHQKLRAELNKLYQVPASAPRSEGREERPALDAREWLENHGNSWLAPYADLFNAFAASRLGSAEQRKSLNDWAKAIGEWGERKGWHENWNVVEKLCLVHSEVSEALEHLREGRDPAEVFYTDTNKPDGFGIEIADTIIRLLHICYHHGINIDELMEVKMAYNEKRPYKHGGKKL